MTAEARDAALWRWQHGGASPAVLSLEPMDFDAIPGWRDDNHADALACYLRSAALAPHLPRPVCDPAARLFFEAHFRPCRVNAEQGLLTSYFEPVLEGSRMRSAAFPVPVYRRPSDLSLLPTEHPLAAHGLSAARAMAAGFEPYFTRGEIEAGALEDRGRALLYLADAVDAFIMHVQGSGVVKLEDGTRVRLTFDGKNGHPYTSISQWLIAHGKLSVGDAHLEGMKAWLRAEPGREAVLAENRSYIFFRELDASAAAPRGSSGVDLYPGRSLATDPAFHPAGTLLWVSAPDLTFQRKRFQRLTVAQDTGSAIKGPQRGDIFAGTGDAAGESAGAVRHSCDFIVLQPRC
ncbi:transglycosylase [Rhodomicrobium udaipurense JA643]|uniref:peptidoglycan lytic exotransglycosylase n=1 Tax=Rhodomicrobium udaipurense TaxID=1202716 RepID=A0A8I1G9V3_9HYPH|nr:MltA domain-containing protein [Rhodomicrobium udaipurense]KAI95860.1 transglycosylase [Rhodomicrobium udaipurense JA643]MBJ7543198.1 MltA domain-containing protein [Rhodomicrobium udaipurense]